MSNYSESTGSKEQDEFNKWADELSKMSDAEVSREIFKRIMLSDDLSKAEKDIFKDAYEYCWKLIDQHKPLQLDLMKIYLEQLKGYELNKVNFVNLFMMLGMCGINFVN